MRAFVEVLGCGPADCSSSVQICFEDGRYLFECGDGTQRLCTEYSVKLGKLRSICLSSMAAPSIGGLLGLLLTVADTGKEGLTIIAPSGISMLLRAAKEFCWRPNFRTTIEEVDIEAHPAQLPLKFLEDKNLTIEAVPIKARRDVEIDVSFGAHYDAVTYICRLKDIRGKFQPKKAMELGVPKGKAFGILQRGGTYTCENGRVVTADEVMTASTLGPVVLIVACPTTEHVPSLVSSHALDPVQLGVLGGENSQEERRTVVLCHLAPANVVSLPDYRNWCNSFGEAATHISLHSSMSSPKAVYMAQAEVISKLHHSLDRNIFPLPRETFTPKEEPISSTEGLDKNRLRGKSSAVPGFEACDQHSKVDKLRVSKNWKGKWIESDCRTKFILSPVAKVGLDHTEVRPRFLEMNQNFEQEYWQNIPSPGEKEPLGGSAENALPDCLSLRQRGDTIVRFLGTGSAIPGNRRNVSAIMIDRFHLGSILLDCGEGTWGQMVRLLGLRKAQDVIRRMTVLFISHMHADHHLGLLNLLHARTMAIKSIESIDDVPQLAIIGPPSLYNWLDAFQAAAKVPLRNTIKAIRNSYRFCSAKTLVDPKEAAESQYFVDSHSLEIGCVEVRHCPFSYGIIIYDIQKNWKVVYSGDTMPCDRLAEAGKGATLAIHEATLEDEMADEALAKRHSTVSQALDICANKMQAWRTILTHFSQRYPRIPLLTDDIVSKMAKSRAMVAFDMMCVDFSRLHELPRIVPSLLKLFPDEVPVEVGDEKVMVT